jgi:riboflavin synthase
MFTGIVEAVGTVEELRPVPGGWRLSLSAGEVLAGVALGDSVAVNGCCLTVVEIGAGRAAFDVLEETRRRTNFPGLREGDSVNLERSLRLDGRIGGHFVSGHIDGVGRIEALERRGADTYLRVLGPEGSGRYVISKGSIAIDGISLTVAEVEGDALAVWLIPHTLAATNLRGRGVGDAVNLEFDLLGKYVEKLLKCGLRSIP